MIVAEKREDARLLQLESRDDGSYMLWITEHRRPDRNRGHVIKDRKTDEIMAEYRLDPVNS